jgi:hypothetical protein
MKIIFRLILLFVFAVFLVGSAAAQGKTTRQRTANKPAAKADPRNEAARRVAEQIKNLTKFLYLFSALSKDLAAADAAVKRGEASREVANRTRQNKAALLNSLQNVRDGLDKLEADFRFTPQLQPYFHTLKGVAESAAGAEEQAAASEYENAGRTLLDVVYQLTDVLLAMR